MSQGSMSNKVTVRAYVWKIVITVEEKNIQSKMSFLYPSKN